MLDRLMWNCHCNVTHLTVARGRILLGANLANLIFELGGHAF